MLPQALKTRKKHDGAAAITASYDGYQVMLGSVCCLTGVVTMVPLAVVVQ